MVAVLGQLVRVAVWRLLAIAVPLVFLWAWVTDAGGFRTWAVQLITEHFVNGITHALLPAGS